jgi:Flp pilus assembly pilin Flp
MMRPLITPFTDFVRNRDARTAVEVAVMLALIALVCIGAIGQLGCGSPAKR